jgi:hypothetical protein
MIDEPDLPAGHLQIAVEEETTMLKTISAALLAVSVIAAPAFAAGQNKAAQAPVSKTVQAPLAQTANPNAKVATKSNAKSGVLNANAKMGRHHKHYRHHRHYKKMGALKAHTKMSFKPVTKSHSKVSFKHTAPIAKRG